MRENIRKYLVGDWSVICDSCGQQRKRSECQLSYGSGDLAVLVTCIDGCSDYRHPLNSPPPVLWDGRPVPDARPDVPSDQATYIVTIPVNTPSPYRIGVSHPGGNIGHTNPDESPFFLGILQYIGLYH